MNRLLNILSVVGSFLIVFGILFLIQNETIGRIAALKNIKVFGGFLYLKDLIFTATSLLFILKFIDFYVPKRNE